MTDKEKLQLDLRAAEAERRAADEKVAVIEHELWKIEEAERKAHEKANSGTRIEEVLYGAGTKYRIARGSYYDDPKYFSFYSDGQPVWTKIKYGGHLYKTRAEAEQELAEIRKAEKEARDARKKVTPVT